MLAWFCRVSTTSVAVWNGWGQIKQQVSWEKSGKLLKKHIIPMELLLWIVAKLISVTLICCTWSVLSLWSDFAVGYTKHSFFYFWNILSDLYIHIHVCVTIFYTGKISLLLSPCMHYYFSSNNSITWFFPFLVKKMDVANKWNAKPVSNYVSTLNDC